MPIGQEVVFRVGKTRSGAKVTKYDGRGLAEGISARGYTRYFYGSESKDPEEQATDYAEAKAEDVDGEARVVELGERI